MENPAVHAVILSPLVISLARVSPICDWTDRHVVDVRGTLNLWPGARRKKFDVGQRHVHAGRLSSRVFRPVHKDLLPVDGFTPGGYTGRTLVQAFLARKRNPSGTRSRGIRRVTVVNRNRQMG